MWRVIVRMSFTGGSLRQPLDKLLKGCGIQYAKNTGTWEGPKVSAAAAARQLGEVFRYLNKHYSDLDEGKIKGPRIEHLWLYIDRAKIPKVAPQATAQTVAAPQSVSGT